MLNVEALNANGMLSSASEIRTLQFVEDTFGIGLQ